MKRAAEKFCYQPLKSLLAEALRLLLDTERFLSRTIKTNIKKLAE